MVARRSSSDANADEPARDIHADRPEYLTALDALTVPQLNEVIHEAQRLRGGKLDAAPSEFLNRVKAESDQLGLDFGSLFQAQPKRGRGSDGDKRKGSVAAKYRDPNGEEWSGRGRAPKWVQAAEAEGKKKEDFLIDKPETDE